jgi:hypothetical protein
MAPSLPIKEILFLAAPPSSKCAVLCCSHQHSTFSPIPSRPICCAAHTNALRSLSHSASQYTRPLVLSEPWRRPPSMFNMESAEFAHFMMYDYKVRDCTRADPHNYLHLCRPAQLFHLPLQAQWGAAYAPLPDLLLQPPKAGHSGYLKNSGRVIRVLKIATRFLPRKSITRSFGYPIIRVRVLSDISEIDKTNHFGRIQVPF